MNGSKKTQEEKDHFSLNAPYNSIVGIIGEVRFSPMSAAIDLLHSYYWRPYIIRLKKSLYVLLKTFFFCSI
jgi:hypothetical protein